MLDSLQSHMTPREDGGSMEIHLAIDHHDPEKGMTLQSAYTDAALRQVADSLRIEFLLRMLNMVRGPGIALQANVRGLTRPCSLPPASPRPVCTGAERPGAELRATNGTGGYEGSAGL